MVAVETLQCWIMREGEGNHSTSVISRLGLVGGGGAVVMV